MDELFNWGEETPEQRHARLQWEHELLLEQARKRFNMIVMTGGAAGGSGSASEVDLTANQYVENDYVEDYFV
jgi:hypothetical protein